MLIYLLGDTHSKLPPALTKLSEAASLGCHVIIQLGDFGIWSTKGGIKFLQGLNQRLEMHGQYLYFVDGNHEDFPFLNVLRSEKEGICLLNIPGVGVDRSRILHIPRGSVFELGGRTIFGMGGAVSIDRSSRLPGVSWFKEEIISMAEEEYATEVARSTKHVDLMVSHDCPVNVPLQNRMVNDPMSHLNRQVISRIANAAKPKLWVHGHMHEFMQYNYGDIDVVGLTFDGHRNSSAIYNTVDGSLTFEDGYDIIRHG